MSTIEFKDLNESIGTELFTNTESFLEDLGDDAADVVGGNGNRSTTAYGLVTTHYRSTDHHIDTGISYFTKIPHQPQVIIPPLRPVHPVRHPRPIHPVFSGNEI